MAFLAGALAVLSQAPYDFFAVCFVSFPVLVWLLDGATVERPARLAAPPAAGLRGRLVVRLRLFRRRAVVGRRRDAGRGRRVRLGAADRRRASCRRSWRSSMVWRPPLARLFWTDDIGRIAALAASFALLRVGPHLHLHRLSVESDRLCRDADAAADAVGLGGRNARHECACGVRVRDAGAACRLSHTSASAWRWPCCSSPPMSASAISGSPRRTRRRSASLAGPHRPAVDRPGRSSSTALRATRFSAPCSTCRPRRSPPDRPKPKLIIWPETSLPFLLTDRPDALVAIGELLADGQVLLAGNVRAEGQGKEARRYYNSVVAINDRGEIIDAVDKLHLVPGGEYLPSRRACSGRSASTASSPCRRRSRRERYAIRSRLPTACGRRSSSATRSFFPTRSSAGVKGADFIVNVTNDAWFGDTPGPYQHFRNAQIRAADTGLPVARSANNGISGAIDSRGRVIDAFALNVRGKLDVDARHSHALVAAARRSDPQRIRSRRPSCG